MVEALTLIGVSSWFEICCCPAQAAEYGGHAAYALHAPVAKYERGAQYD
jgi:hypothetical protein